ncbi:MAG: peptidylprolyl isomerase [Planctomycetota bacterium]
MVESLSNDEVPPSTMIDARPAALVEGRIVDWGELRPLLNEAAGSDVLAEVILDRMLARELHDAGILITAEELDAERALFYDTLSDDPDVAARLARQVRARQGLGPTRLDRLLKRNAALRALVRDRVEINDEAVRRMYDIVHGPKRQARLIIAPTLNDAQAAINRANAGELFADVAVDVSTDSSAARGGLLEPISRADASYPQAMREALWALVPGELSRPVFLSDNYAVLSLVRVVDGDGADFYAVRPDLERLVRLNQERILMDELARRLLTEASITIIDDKIKWSWDSRRNR